MVLRRRVDVPADLGDVTLALLAQPDVQAVVGRLPLLLLVDLLLAGHAELHAVHVQLQACKRLAVLGARLAAIAT